MNKPDEYFLGYMHKEQERLQQQAEQLAHESSWLFDQIGLQSGANALEIGCGPRGCLDLLAARVGPTGRIVGIERNKKAVILARELVEKLGIGNVEVLHGDARSSKLKMASFDLVTARLVLVNVPNPKQIVSEAIALACSGGTVAFHEIDWVGVVCDPPEPAWTALVELFVTYTKANGIDLFIGRKLPRLLRDAGLIDVRVNPIVHVHPPEDIRRSLIPDFAENLRERIVAQNLITDKNFVELQEKVKSHIENPETFVMVGPYVQVWGRKPE